MAKIQTTEAYFNPFGRFIYYNTWYHKRCVLLNEQHKGERVNKQLKEKNVKSNPNILIQSFLPTIISSIQSMFNFV